MNINVNFGKLDSVGNFSYAPRDLEFDNRTYVNCKIADFYFSSGYREVIEDKEDRLGVEAVFDYATQEEDVYGEINGLNGLIYRGKIIRHYKYIEIVAPQPNKMEYDRAMENHLTQERFARGYTDREPTDYMNSTVERFKQDAIDWNLHRDQVMLYGLSVINEYDRTGNAPSLNKFIENLPNIIWTYQMEM